MGLGDRETEARVALRRRQGHSVGEVFLLCVSNRVPVGPKDRSCRKEKGKGQVDRVSGLLSQVLGFNKRIGGSQGIPECPL